MSEQEPNIQFCPICQRSHPTSIHFCTLFEETDSLPNYDCLFCAGDHFTSQQPIDQQIYIPLDDLLRD